MIKIVIDPGHGGTDRANVGPTGYVEADGNLKTALYLEEALQDMYSNAEVTLTRRADEYLSLTARGNMGADADIFHSIHSNAGPSGARGCEVFYSVDLPHTQTFAAAMSKAIADLFSTTDRGAKTRESTKYPGEDYYTVIDRPQDLGAKIVLLSESLFHSDPTEEAFLKDDVYLKGIAQTMAKVYGQFLPLEKKEAKTPIITGNTATVEQGQEWARSKGASEEFIGLAPLFWEIAAVRWINAPGMYAQSAKETGYGNFGGVLDASYHNPCGMKTAEGGGNYDPNAHQRFTDWREGITAMADHLALYAGLSGYPLDDTPDPRHFPYIAGTAPNWEDLSGKWAGSSTYGSSIVSMLYQIEATEAPESTYTDEEVQALEQQLAAMTTRALAAEDKLARIGQIVEEA